MSGKPKRAWNSDRVSGSPSSPGRKALETDGGSGSPGLGLRQGMEEVETLVGDFLKELDALATELQHRPAARSERQPKFVAAPVPARDPGLVLPSPPLAEREILREREQGQRSDIDAELARTLDELELQVRSNVIVLPSAVTRAAAVGPEPTAPPEPHTRAAPEARPATAAGEIAGTAPQPPRALFSSAGLSRPRRRIWKSLVRAAAVVFLAAAAFTVYRLLPVAPHAIAPSSPPAATTSRQAGENAEITQVPESAAPKPGNSAAKPSKAAASRPAEPDQTPARPAQDPVPKRESAAPEPPASQAVSAALQPASKVPASTPEPAPVASQAAAPPPPEAKVAAGERETPPSAGGTPAEPQAPPAAKPVPQAALPSQPATQEAARPGAEISRPEVVPANTPVAAASGGAARETVAAQPAPAPPVPSYTPPVAIEKPAPVYPPLARNTKITGTVEVEVQVDEQGRVVKATAVSGPSLLRAAAEDALRRWRFTPAVRNGINVRSVVRISVIFRE